MFLINQELLPIGEIKMLTWLKNLFGSDYPETPVITQEPVKEETKSQVSKKVEQVKPIAKPKKQTKKPATKKTAKVDLDSMKKNELLDHAKANGIKANASMNKAALIDAIKNG